MQKRLRVECGDEHGGGRLEKISEDVGEDGFWSVGMCFLTCPKGLILKKDWILKVFFKI